MGVLLGYRPGWLHSAGHVRIGPTTRLAVTAVLRVGAAVGSLAGIDTGLVADCGLSDTSGAVDSGSDKSETDCDGRAGDWTDDTDEVVADDEVSWQHRRVGSGCIAGRVGSLHKDCGTLWAKGVGKMVEVVE